MLTSSILKACYWILFYNLKLSVLCSVLLWCRRWINDVRMPGRPETTRQCLLSGQISSMVPSLACPHSAVDLPAGEQPVCFLPPRPAPPTRGSPLALALWGFHEDVFTAGGRWWAHGMVLRRNRCGLPVFTVTQTCGRALL